MMTAKMKNQKKNKQNKKVKKPMIIRIMISNHYGNRRCNNLIKLKRMINQKKKKKLASPKNNVMDKISSLF